MSDRFTWQAGDVEVSQCLYCKLWRQGACNAFPDGIPYAILANKVDHTNPYPNDGGIRFEPRSKEAKQEQDLIFKRKAERDKRESARATKQSTPAE